MIRRWIAGILLHPRRSIDSLIGRRYVPRTRSGRGAADLGGGRFRLDAPAELHLEGPVPQGWVEIVLEARADARCAVTLAYRWDRDPRGWMRRPLGTIGPERVRLASYANLTHASDVRLSLSRPATSIEILSLHLERRARWRVLARATRLYLRRPGRQARTPTAIAARVLSIVARGGTRGLADAVARQLASREYDGWVERHRLDDEERRSLGTAIAVAELPTISVLVPVHDTPAHLLERCIGSVRSQILQRWELCLADDASTAPHVRPILARHASEDGRIKVVLRDRNGHIAAASNSALAIASGEYVALLDHDDELSEDALAQGALELARHPSTDLLYSDEDKIDDAGRRFDPYFKPDWSPETLLGCMYLGHLGVYRRSMANEVGAFREGYEGSQDYDLALRVSERARRVGHVPRVLYHWRATRGSTASAHRAKPYAYVAAARALADALARRGLAGRIEPLADLPGFYVAHPGLPRPTPRVSVVIPCRGSAETLDRCLASLFERTAYDPYEVILVASDDGSTTPEAIARWERREAARVRVVRRDLAPTLAARANAGVASSSGDLVLLLSDGCEVLQADWLERMAAFAVQEGIGAVGACLVDRDGTVRQGGMVLTHDDIATALDDGTPLGMGGHFNRLAFHVNVSAVSGACLMARRAEIEAAGGLDERLAAYADVDLCLRTLARGKRVVALNHVRLLHADPLGDGADDPPTERAASDRRIMRDRWADALARDRYYSPNLRRDPPDFSVELG